MLLTGCRLDLAGVVELERDASGVVAITIRMDDALLDELDDLAVDPTVEVTALVPQLDDWELERRVGEDRSITVTLARSFDHPSEVGEILRSLSSGLAAEDPALVIDIDLSLDDEGEALLSGDVGFRPPQTIGAELDGESLGPSAEELRTLTEELVRPLLTVTLPGPIETSDADRVEGRTLTWAVPIDGVRTVSASSSAPGLHEQPWLWAVVVGLLVILAAVGLARRRRR